MNKYIISFLVMLMVIISSFILNLKQEDNIMVFNEYDNDYGMYILQFPNYNISTNNLENKFRNIKIIWLEPYINILYKDKLDYKKYYFEDISLKENINRFKNYFLTKLKDNNFNIEAINYQISGIKISKMKIYASEEDINKLNIEGIKFKKVE